MRHGGLIIFAVCFEALDLILQRHFLKNCNFHHQSIECLIEEGVYEYNEPRETSVAQSSRRIIITSHFHISLSTACQVMSMRIEWFFHLLYHNVSWLHEKPSQIFIASWSWKVIEKLSLTFRPALKKSCLAFANHLQKIERASSYQQFSRERPDCDEATVSQFSRKYAREPRPVYQPPPDAANPPPAASVLPL